jgi:hypothetical protein
MLFPLHLRPLSEDLHTSHQLILNLIGRLPSCRCREKVVAFDPACAPQDNVLSEQVLGLANISEGAGLVKTQYRGTG